MSQAMLSEQNNEHQSDDDLNLSQNTDDENNEALEENKNNQEIPVQQEKKKRKTVNRMTFKPEQLLDSKKGMKVLYNRMLNSKYFNQEKIPEEFQALQKLMSYYQEWHYQLIPKYDFNYFIDRCQKFGTLPIIKAHQNRMRKIHKGEFRWEEIEDEVAQEINKTNNNNDVFNSTINNQDVGGALLNTQNLNTENVSSTLIQNIQNQRINKQNYQQQQQQKQTTFSISRNPIQKKFNFEQNNQLSKNNENKTVYQQNQNQKQQQNQTEQQDLDQLYYQQQQEQQQQLQNHQNIIINEEIIPEVQDQDIDNNDEIVCEPNADFYSAFPENFEEIENLDLERQIKKFKVNEDHENNNQNH